MSSEYIVDHHSSFQKVIEHLKKEITSLRTGRANPQLVEGIQVEAYGVMQPLQSVASITVPDAQTIQVEPWDKSVVKNVEKAILVADIGFNPVVAGTVIRIPMPPMTEENRKHLVKVLKEKLEEARIGVRKVRDEARTKITSAEKGGDISEDEKYQLHEDLDKVAAGFNEQIKNIGDEKEVEIMKI